MRMLTKAAALLWLAVFPASLAAATSLTLYGEPKYKPGFTHFDYVNPNAPKGGLVKLAEMGSYDSLNPFILKGVKAPGVQSLVFQSLMAGSLDEPQSFYPNLASEVDIAKDRLSVTFTMNPAARWHDGKPVTAEDVAWSFHTLKEKGDPTYAILYKPITDVKAKGNQVTFYFDDASNRELPFLAASMPVLPKHYYDSREFDKTTLEPPLGSGPYKISAVDVGRSLTFKRVKDWWAKDLPVNRGLYNFDTIRYDMYRDENVSLEAFKAGAYDFRREYIARNWATAYDSPALSSGKFIKREIPDATPQGMQAFVFNLRQPKFSDRRVREAINLTMDYAWLNKTIFYGAYTRNTSYFLNTPFAADALPTSEEVALLAPYKALLAPTLFTEVTKQPETDGSGNARQNLLKAQALLNEAGYVVKDGKRLNPATGEPMEIEFLLRQPTMERVIGPMRKNLERLGITATIRHVDDAQYQKRIEGFDFDIVSIWINRGVFYPGNEQMLLWHSSQADIKGSNNIAGLKNEAVDAVLAALISAKEYEDLLVAGRALDRVLLSEWLVIPNWHSSSFRIAYWDKFGMPNISPLYDTGFTSWWIRE